MGRITELIQQGQSGGNAVTAKRATFAYNALNQRTLVSRYQSTGTTIAVATTEYSYDTLNRLSGLTHKQGSTLTVATFARTWTALSVYTYAYDGMSRLASVTSTIEGLSSYSYDATSQVVGADHASGGQADESYSFDANGNRNSIDYTVDTNNHITADANFTYAYDDQGNRTSRTDSNTGEVTEYSWDHRNLLVTVNDRASYGGSVVKQVDYAYDAFNRLVKRSYDADGAGTYLYRIIATARVVATNAKRAEIIQKADAAYMQAERAAAQKKYWESAKEMADEVDIELMEYLAEREELTRRAAMEAFERWMNLL